MPVAIGSPMLADFLADWLTNVAVHRVRPNTLASYETNVRLHIVPRLGKRRLDKLTPRDVRNMLKLAADDRLSALIVVTLLLGLRRSEALALFWSDIDLEGGTLQIRRSLRRLDGRLVFLGTKTSDSERTVPLPPMVARALREHQERQEQERAAAEVPWPDSELVFTTLTGEPIKPWNFTRMFGRLCDRAAVPRSRLHDLRHTCVSLLLALGVPPRVVMEIVGHSTIEMTMTVYGHVSLDTQREALGKLDDLLGGE
jgi:integrase